MEYKQCIYVRQSIPGSTSASRTVHSGSTPKKLKENEGWDRNNKETAKAPVLTDFTQTKSMEVYLPADTRWYNYWTNEAIEGGQKLTVSTTLNRIPLFVRAGSIVPYGPEVQYTSEKNGTI